MIHTKIHKQALVDTLFDLWLCFSYQRVLDISTELGNKSCHHYEMEKVVCPLQLRSGLFTTAAVDNIDHNPSSTSAHDSFHGTGISLFQRPDDSFTGVKRNVATNPENTQMSLEKVSSAAKHICQCASCCSTQTGSSIATEKQIISTHDAEVLCTKPRDVSGLAPCTWGGWYSCHITPWECCEGRV